MLPEQITLEPFIKIRKYNYEEPDCILIEWIISNGRLLVKTDIYLNVSDIEGIADALTKFPTNLKDEYQYIYGSAKSEDDFYRYFMLRAYVIDVEHCGLQFKINQNEQEPNEGSCLFTLKCEANALNHLGNALKKFSRLDQKELHWTLDSCELYEEHNKIIEHH